MAIAITTNPALPVPNRDVTVGFELTGGGTHVQLYVTDAPIGGALKEELDASGAERVLVFDGTSRQRYSFMPGAGGVFHFAAVEILRGTTGGGAYEGDENSTPVDTELGETTFTVEVGDRVTIELGTGNDTAKLVLWLYGDTIRRTTREQQGEDSPAIVEAETVRSRAVVNSAAVISSVSGLADLTAKEALGDPAAVVTNLVANIEGHVADTAVHYGHDLMNVPPAGLRNPASQAGMVESLSLLRDVFGAHLRTEDASQDATAVPGGATFHRLNATGAGAADWENAFFYGYSGGGPLDAMKAVADTWRAYEGHRVSGVHRAEDGAHSLDPLPPLLRLHQEFLNRLRRAPTAAPADSAGVLTLVEQAGALSD